MAFTSGSMETGKRALLVEPNLDTQNMCRTILERSGFLVDAVASGLQAVVCARTKHPDLILVDQQLPDGPCYQAIGWLRSNPSLRSIPIVVLNGSASDASVSETSRVAVIPRPLSTQSLERAIQRASDFNECCGPH
jgi:CheY-like chemotaxis protein